MNEDDSAAIFGHLSDLDEDVIYPKMPTNISDVEFSKIQNNQGNLFQDINMSTADNTVPSLNTSQSSPMPQFHPNTNIPTVDSLTPFTITYNHPTFNNLVNNPQNQKLVQSTPLKIKTSKKGKSSSDNDTQNLIESYKALNLNNSSPSGHDQKHRNRHAKKQQQRLTSRTHSKVAHQVQHSPSRTTQLQAEGTSMGTQQVNEEEQLHTMGQKSVKEILEEFFGHSLGTYALIAHPSFFNAAPHFIAPKKYSGLPLLESAPRKF